MDTLHTLDDRLLLAVGSFARQTSWLHAPLVSYTRYGVLLFGLLLLAGLVVSRHRCDQVLASAGWAGAGTLLAVGVNQVVGHAVAEPRPYVAHPDLLLLVSRTSDFSFPSDHAVMAGAAAAGLLLVSRRLGLLAAAAGALMAFSRVYVGAHYPWDVLAGLALGAVVVLLGRHLLAGPLVALTRHLRRQPLLAAAFAPEALRTAPGQREATRA